MFPSIKRVVIIIGGKCNFSCVYCMRDDISDIEDVSLTPSFIKYLSQLSPDTCESVVITGGEPLLYLDAVKDIFSAVPKNVHKKIITNGSLLTPEIVSYINTNNIELNLSHDGILTKTLRGRDILEDPLLVNLIKQVKILAINATIVSGNEDIMDIYRYLKTKLDGKFFMLNISDLFLTSCNQGLLTNFNYNLFKKSFNEYFFSYFRPTMYYNRIPRPGQSMGINFRPNGDIVDMYTLHKYGDVQDSIDFIRDQIRIYTQNSYCAKCDPCPIKTTESSNCFASVSSPHYCTIRKIKEGWI